MNKSKQNRKSKTSIYYTDANGGEKSIQPSAFSGSYSRRILFIYQGAVPQGRENQSVFDFSIQ